MRNHMFHYITRLAVMLVMSSTELLFIVLEFGTCCLQKLLFLSVTNNVPASH